MIKNICLCLDGGFKHHMDFVESLDIPVSFAISTKTIGKDGYMNWDDIKKLSRKHEIVCRGHDLDAWNITNFDIENDIKTSLENFHAHSIFPKGFVPPRNDWIESPVIKDNFSFGRVGDDQLHPDLFQIKSCGLSSLKITDLQYAYRFNDPRPWAVYVAHLYNNRNFQHELYYEEYKVVFKLIEFVKTSNAKFVTLEEIAKEYNKELYGLYTKCQICGGDSFEDSGPRKRAKCCSCQVLERHRDVAWFIDEGIINVKGKKCLCVSSGELYPVLKRNGAEIRLISKFQKPPYNDVQDLSACKDFDCAFLQHVLVCVDNPKLAMQSLCRALKDDGVIYLQHPVFKELSQHEPMPNGNGLYFSETQFLEMIKSLNLNIKSYPILPTRSDFMFEVTK